MCGLVRMLPFSREPESETTASSPPARSSPKSFRGNLFSPELRRESSKRTFNGAMKGFDTESAAVCNKIQVFRAPNGAQYDLRRMCVCRKHAVEFFPDSVHRQAHRQYGQRIHRAVVQFHYLCFVNSDNAKFDGWAFHRHGVLSASG